MARYGTWRRAALAVAAILSAGSGLFVGGTAMVPAQAAAPSNPAAWGNNKYGQLGDSTSARTKTDPSLTYRPLAGAVVNLTNVTAMAAGGDHSLALLSDTSVWAWGYNFNGQLGTPPPNPNTNRVSPALVPGLTGVTAVAAGNDFSLALKGVDGSVWSWGNNSFGQLGDNTQVRHTSPAAIAGLTGVTAISAGYSHSLALKGDGSVWAWGLNNYGQLGNNTSVDSKVPVQVVGVGGVGTLSATAISAGTYHNLALSGGSVVAWGNDTNGQLGDKLPGSSVNPFPVQVSGLGSPSGVSALAAGSGQSLALKSNGTVLAWGDNALGQLGDNTTKPRFAPAPVVGLSAVSAVSAAQNTSLALKSDASAWAWGDNTYGAVGDNTITSRTAPVPVLGISGVTALGIGASGLHSLAVVGAFTPVLSAAYGIASSPSTWTTGQTQTYSITVTNKGNQTWSAAGAAPVKLGVHFANAPGGTATQPWLTDQHFALAADLAPGASAPVTVTVTAPNSAGSLTLEYQMVQDGTVPFWFGQFASTAATVSPPPPPLSAAYGTSTSPTAWTVGQTLTYSITVTNTGSQPWLAAGATPVKLGVHFANAPGGTATQPWLTDQRFALAADLAPGASVPVTVTVTAPNSAGSFTLEYQMVQDGTVPLWFGQFASVQATVSPPPPPWSAAYGTATSPTSWIVGQTLTYSVTVTNTGTQPWSATSATPVHLGVHFMAASGWVTDQRFTLPGDLAPGASVTLTIPVTAPAGTGPMTLQYQMVQETQFWFSQTSDVSVTVAPTAWSASYSVLNTPTAWVAGQTQSYAVTVTNTGNLPWSAAGATPVHLGVHFIANGSQVTDQRFTLPGDLAPGASVTLTIPVTAPAGTGPMTLQYQMVQETQFWFSQTSDVSVTVAPTAWSASYSVLNTPTAWAAGQTQSYAVTVTNTGNLPWSAAGATPVHLGVHFIANGSQVTDQRFALPGDLAPGATVTLTIPVTAPAGTGAMTLQYQMVQETQFWFSQTSDVSVTVAPAAWSSGYGVLNTPANWAPGQTQSYSVTVTNTGNLPWIAAGATPVHLGVHFIANSGQVTDQRFTLPGDLAPGASVTLTIPVTAPAGSGAMTLQYQMVQENRFWFSQTSDVSVTVAAVWSASYNVLNTPTGWTSGQTQSYAVTVTNTGNQPWSAAGATPVHLGVHFIAAGGWVTDQRFTLPGDLAPGASVTLTIPVTAPAGTGAMTLQYQMVQETQFWFSQTSDTPITVI